MKKSILVFIATFAVICLSACEPEMFWFEYDEISSNVISVELINYCTLDLHEIESEDEIYTFIFYQMEVIEILDIASIDNFFFDLSNIEFHNRLDYSNTPVGISVKITYENGDLLILSSTLINEIAYGGAFLYNSEGVIIEYYGNFAIRQQYVDLVNMYFETQTD